MKDFKYKVTRLNNTPHFVKQNFMEAYQNTDDEESQINIITHAVNMIMLSEGMGASESPKALEYVKKWIAELEE